MTYRYPAPMKLPCQLLLRDSCSHIRRKMSKPRQKFRKLVATTQRVVRAVSPGGGKTQQTDQQSAVLHSQSSSSQSIQPAPPLAGQAQSSSSSTTNIVPPSILVPPSLGLGGHSSISLQRPVTPKSARPRPDPALKDAIESYAAQLSDNDKAAFRSAGDIMNKLNEIDKADTQASLLRSLHPRIGKVLQCLQYFLGSVAICTQCNPDISSLVVGGFNCVLLLVLGYIEFFERLTIMMERIGGHLQYLSEYGSLMFQKSPDVQNALKSAYCDLLDFFVAVRSVFTDKGGRVSYLKSFKLFLKLTWEPFESKFKPIQERFFDHTLIVVRAAGVQELIMNYEGSRQKDLRNKAEKRRKVLQWLSPIDFEETHQKHFKKHFGNTGQWLIDHPHFPVWKDTLGSSLLWCHAGTGKTVLASLVVEKISRQYELSNDTGVAFLYCNYKEPHDNATYMKVAIKQLCRRMNELPVELETLYDNASSPGCTELQNVFMGVSKRFKKVFLVLDALDECQEEQREELFDVLHCIVSSPIGNYGNVKLFITSRKEPDIERAFTSSPMINIEAKKVDADIESYVIAQLDQYLQNGTLRLRDISLKQKIITALVSRAGGMFLWIELQLKHICSQTSDPEIEQALESLPEDMQQTYERIISVINQKPSSQRKLARRTLMWIAYAKRPLLLEELVCAVAMENDTKNHEALQSKLPQAKTLFDVCANLVVLDNTTEDSKSTVQFVHFSVQEFLLRNSLKSGNHSNVAALNIGLELAHAEMARLCITFLLFCRYGPLHDAYGFSPLITYAESAWMDHVSNLTGIDKDFMALIFEFFNLGVFLLKENWYLTSYGPSIRFYSYAARTKFSPSTIALIFNLPVVFEQFEKQFHTEQCNPQDAYAMHYAAKLSSYKAIERLYSQGFLVDELDSNRCTPLHYATSKEVCQSLLDRGADTKKQGKYGDSLQAAAYHGGREVVQLLLDRGADVNAGGGEYGNALLAAASSGDVEVVQLLLDRGADVNAVGGKYGSALQAATHSGKVEVVQCLLDRDAEVNAEGGVWGSALRAATYLGELQMVQLLLDNGAIERDF